jgi:hypothetical protein
MKTRIPLHAILLALIFFGMMFISYTIIARPSPATAAVRTAKCTIEIAEGQQSDCTLVKANHEWILWSNSSSGPRSVHFKPDDNPFTEQSCWDIVAGARARSGPIALDAAPKTYVAYTSGTACATNPPSTATRGTSKVTIQ